MSVLSEQMEAIKVSDKFNELSQQLKVHFDTLEEELYEPLDETIKHTINDFYRLQLKYFDEIHLTVEEFLGGLEGWSDIKKHLDYVIETHREGIRTEMVADFKKELSAHDVVRNKLRYIRNLLKLPENIIQQELKNDAKQEEIDMVNEVIENDETAVA